jgi:hypothetical protein
MDELPLEYILGNCEVILLYGTSTTLEDEIKDIGQVCVLRPSRNLQLGLRRRSRSDDSILRGVLEPVARPQSPCTLSTRTDVRSRCSRLPSIAVEHELLHRLASSSSRSHMALVHSSYPKTLDTSAKLRLAMPRPVEYVLFDLDGAHPSIQSQLRT